MFCPYQNVHCHIIKADFLHRFKLDHLTRGNSCLFLKNVHTQLTIQNAPVLRAANWPWKWDHWLEENTLSLLRIFAVCPLLVCMIFVSASQPVACSWQITAKYFWIVCLIRYIIVIKEQRCAQCPKINRLLGSIINLEFNSLSTAYTKVHIRVCFY